MSYPVTFPQLITAMEKYRDDNRHTSSYLMAALWIKENYKHDDIEKLVSDLSEIDENARRFGYLREHDYSRRNECYKELKRIAFEVLYNPDYEKLYMAT